MILKTKKKFESMIPYINWKKVSFDFETTDLDWFILEATSFQIYDGKWAVYVDLSEDRQKILEALFAVLLKSNEMLLGHNLVFDLKVLAKYIGRERLNEYLVKVKLIDTYIGAYLIDERVSHKLKGPGSCCERFLNRTPMEYAEAMTYGMDSKEFQKYATDDVINTWDLWIEEEKEIKAQELEFVFDVEMNFLPVQIEMELVGVRVDVEYLREVETKLDLIICELEEQILHCLFGSDTPAGFLFEMNADVLKLGSSQEVIKLVKKHMNLDIPDTKKETIQQYVNGHPFFALYLKWKAATKLLNTFVTPYWKLKGPDGKVHPNFHIITTGRTSCSDPDLQNQAKENKLLPDVNIRKILTADEGDSLLLADVSAQEMRLAAHNSGDENMLRAFEKGFDIHLFVANRALSLGIDESKLKTEHPEYESIKENYKKERTGFKAINFGILFGKTVWGFSKELGTPTWEAKDLIEGFYRVFPRMREYQAEVEHGQRQYGYTKGTWGRRRRFDIPPSNHDIRAGFNMTCQGSASTHAKKMAGDVWRYFQKFTVKPKILLLIHDELMISAPKDKIHLIQKHVEDIMANAVKLKCPIVIESKIQQTYGG